VDKERSRSLKRDVGGNAVKKNRTGGGGQHAKNQIFWGWGGNRRCPSENFCGGGGKEKGRWTRLKFKNKGEEVKKTMAAS